MDEPPPPPQPKLLIAWALATVLVAILFFAHPARKPYVERVGKFLEKGLGKR